jgi:hypothetical protein
VTPITAEDLTAQLMALLVAAKFRLDIADESVAEFIDSMLAAARAKPRKKVRRGKK